MAKWVPIAILASAQFVMTLDTSVMSVSIIDIAPVDQVEQLAQERGASEEPAQALAADYGDAQLEALRDSLSAVALVALLSPWSPGGCRTPPRRRPGAPRRPSRPSRPDSGQGRAPLRPGQRPLGDGADPQHERVGRPDRVRLSGAGRPGA